MTVAPDTFLPAVFSLDSSNVAGIESSKTDPKVRLDADGVYVTGPDGTRVVQMRSPGGAIDILAAEYKSGTGTPTPPNERRIRWIEQADGSVAADISVYHTVDGGAFAEFMARSTGQQGDNLLALTLGDGRGASMGVSGSLGAIYASATTGDRYARVIDDSGASSFVQTSPVRNLTLFGPLNTGPIATPSGITTFAPAAVPGMVGGILGLMVTSITSLSSHWLFRIHPAGGTFTIQNDAGAQTMAFDYVALGRS